MGGARVIVATAPNSAAISELVGGLGANGMLLTIAGSFDPLTISPAQLIGQRRSIQGWPSGAPKDSEETMNFCALTGIRPMIEQNLQRARIPAARRLQQARVHRGFASRFD